MGSEIWYAINEIDHQLDKLKTVYFRSGEDFAVMNRSQLRSIIDKLTSVSQSLKTYSNDIDEEIQASKNAHDALFDLMGKVEQIKKIVNNEQEESELGCCGECCNKCSENDSDSILEKLADKGMEKIIKNSLVTNSTTMEYKPTYWDLNSGKIEPNVI